MRDKRLYDRPLHNRPIILIPIRFVFIWHDCSMPGVAPDGIEEYGPLNKGVLLQARISRRPRVLMRTRVRISTSHAKIAVEVYLPPHLFYGHVSVCWFHQLVHSITCSLIGYIVRPPFVLVYNKPLAIVEGGRILDPS
ncbi:hypothetical protein XELAEV_18021542mg [Xenopus laevis]|uniref:Uncharacterized protein n=1 Tax=Xenopus laevis TaxID=8355 RepID=A0A974HRG4_XENLA|nr:hypothetical protein XELAEV_18021542mg [Xenopus laevis]